MGVRGLFVVDEWRCTSSAFFLTHMHSDHIQGLSEQWCQGPLYCSSITASLLLAKFRGFERSLIHVLPIGTPSLVSLRSDPRQLVEVTAIDADHCPGAVMFVFRGEFGCIIHTGDFRWESDSENLGNRKRQLIAAIGGSCVDCLYLDNTFCNPCFCFSPRHIAAKQVLDIIASHKGHDVIIGIDMLGKEELLIFIAETLKTKIWIWPARLHISRLLRLPNVFTTDTTSTRIRAVPRNSISIDTLRMLNEVRPTIAVVPTGLWCLCKHFSTCQLHQDDPISVCTSKCCLGSTHAFKEQELQSKIFNCASTPTNIPIPEKKGDDRQVQAENGLIRILSRDIFVVPYSLHSCFSELKEFWELIKPASVRGYLKSSYCDINPSHHFRCLGSMNDKSSKQLSGIVESKVLITNSTEHDGILSCFNVPSEDLCSEVKGYNFTMPHESTLMGKRLRKIAKIRSQVAWTKLQKRRRGQLLLLSEVIANDDENSQGPELFGQEVLQADKCQGSHGK